jgi:hypothetical protein
MCATCIWLFTVKKVNAENKHTSGSPRGASPSPTTPGFWEPGCSHAENSDTSPLFRLPPAVLPRCRPNADRVYIPTATGPSSLQCKSVNQQSKETELQVRQWVVEKKEDEQKGLVVRCDCEHERGRGAQGPGGAVPLGLRDPVALPARQALRPRLPCAALLGGRRRQHHHGFRLRQAQADGGREAAQGVPPRLLGAQLITVVRVNWFSYEVSPLVVGV